MAVLICCMLASAVWGVAGDVQMASYQQINERNAFSLKPLPPPVDPDTLAATQQVNITFTGITSYQGVKKAYFRLPDGTKPGQFTYPTIREGERDGALEVVTINEKAGSVIIKNAGTPMTLTFDTHGNKVAVPMAVAPPAPGVHALPGGAPTPMPVIPPNTPALPATGMPMIPSRPVRSNFGAAAAQPQATYESSVVNMEVQRALISKDGPPLPPTELSSPPPAPQ